MSQACDNRTQGSFVIPLKYFPCTMPGTPRTLRWSQVSPSTTRAPGKSGWEATRPLQVRRHQAAHCSFPKVTGHAWQGLVRRNRRLATCALAATPCMSMTCFMCFCATCMLLAALPGTRISDFQWADGSLPSPAQLPMEYVSAGWPPDPAPHCLVLDVRLYDTLSGSPRQRSSTLLVI